MGQPNTITTEGILTSIDNLFTVDPNFKSDDPLVTMMNSEWVYDIAQMHMKFGVNPVIRGLDKDKLLTFLQFRINFLQEELDELKNAQARLNSAQVLKIPQEALKKQITEAAADDVVDALVDLCVVAIGTMNALDVNADEAWLRVHEANMKKNPGVNPSRPNVLGLPDLIKPTGWTAPSHSDNIGLLKNLI
jgi:predicted HAD superfamily Cof-like phosphohydrolase